MADLATAAGDVNGGRTGNAARAKGRRFDVASRKSAGLSDRFIEHVRKARSTQEGGLPEKRDGGSVPPEPERRGSDPPSRERPERA